MERAEPPRHGHGSDRQTWLSYARGQGVEVLPDDGRNEIIAKVEQHREALGEPPVVVETVLLGAPDAEPIVAPVQVPLEPGEEVTFVCVPYPELIVGLSAKKAADNRIAVFSKGYLTTADPAVIAKLDGADMPDVRRANDRELAVRPITETALAS